MTQGEGRGVRAQVKAYNATGTRQSAHGKRERAKVKGQIARRKSIRQKAQRKVKRAKNKKKEHKARDNVQTARRKGKEHRVRVKRHKVRGKR